MHSFILPVVCTLEPCHPEHNALLNPALCVARSWTLHYVRNSLLNSTILCITHSWSCFDNASWRPSYFSNFAMPTGGCATSPPLTPLPPLWPIYSRRPLMENGRPAFFPAPCLLAKLGAWNPARMYSCNGLECILFSGLQGSFIEGVLWRGGDLVCLQVTFSSFIERDRTL